MQGAGVSKWEGDTEHLCKRNDSDMPHHLRGVTRLALSLNTRSLSQRVPGRGGPLSKRNIRRRRQAEVAHL